MKRQLLPAGAHVLVVNGCGAGAKPAPQAKGHAVDPANVRSVATAKGERGYLAKRTTGLEPATYGLGSRRSTN